MSHKPDKRVGYTTEMSVVDQVHAHGLDVEKREIYLFGRDEFIYGAADEMPAEPGVEYAMANQFIKNLRILQSLGSEPILIHMKTNGGHWAEGMAIYQAIRACPNYCVILNYSHARSMSSIILQAADWRAMLPHTTFMYHGGTVEMAGTYRQFMTEASQAECEHDQMMNIYLDSARKGQRFKGKTDRQILTLLSRQMERREEVYLNAPQTVDHGFADVVFGGDGSYDWNKLRT